MKFKLSTIFAIMWSLSHTQPCVDLLAKFSERPIFFFSECLRFYLSNIVHKPWKLVQDFSASCAAEILGNNLAGWLKLKKFSTNLKWSKIGKLHMNLIQVNWNKCINLFCL